MNKLDLLPNEVVVIIYRFLFDSCLHELKKTYTRDWIDGKYSKYRCNECPCYIKKNFYPNRSPYICSYCNCSLCAKHVRTKIIWDTSNVCIKDQVLCCSLCSH